MLPKSMAPQLLDLGMVTDAAWADIDGDGKPELIIVGDWMPVTIMHYEKGEIQKDQENCPIPPAGGIR